MSRPYSQFRVVLERATDLTPQLRQLTFTGPELQHFGATCLDQRIKLVLPRGRGDDLADFPPGDDWYAAWRALPEMERRPVRTFTPAAVRPEVGEVDVIVARHGDIGPATRWAGAAEPGEQAILVGPDSRLTGHDRLGLEWRPDGAGEVLVVGDETALPAIRSIVAALPETISGRVLLEVPTDADRIALPAPAGVGVEILPRNEKHEIGELLLAAVIGEPTARAELPDDDAILWDTPTTAEAPETGGRRFAWIAGEAGVVTTIRRHLVSTGWDRSEVAFMGYWRRGRAEC
ncbi:NADPH-dependent ferric siderophore reductase [Enemella evansiae]|uniref:siderophore-interacting protein n=1 Tax=Enemella evansiae TaxID=2016499 RepID=UPI000B964A55|nr:siderophore-interacting protein [Enemella evansiae]OYO09321.1 NADPH-dependent ferric siderophore reductase [Enemella evansiae]